jgi:hypothetical protein
MSHDDQPAIYMDGTLLIIELQDFRLTLTPMERLPALTLLRPEIAAAAELVFRSGRGADPHGRKSIVCSICDEAFVPRTPLQRYCSARCGGKANSKQYFTKKASKVAPVGATGPEAPAATKEPDDNHPVGAREPADAAVELER